MTDRDKIKDKIEELRARLASNVELSSSLPQSRAYLDASRLEIECQLAALFPLLFEESGEAQQSPSGG